MADGGWPMAGGFADGSLETGKPYPKTAEPI
jgi:hypothetical protein